MKNLVVCFDGTWNNPEQESGGIAAPTNVVRLYNALAQQDANGEEQWRYYHPGVGGEDIGFKEKVLGGALGVGITRHLQSAYHWLGQHYEAGDRIFIFGYSRGAFTARSLAGFLARGLLDLRKVKPKASWLRVEAAFAAYRANKEAMAIADWAEDGWDFFHEGAETPVHFLGVWDTVGALGIPDNLEILNLFDDREKWQFHDTALGEHVEHARHAMALDEMRASFTVTRWSNAGKHDDAIELWFPGVHGDVGGGNANADLSNGALLWMLEEGVAHGLALRSNILSSIDADPLGVLHDSYRGFFSKLPSRPRNYPEISSKQASRFHRSVLERQAASPIEYPAYHPSRTLAVGESATFDIFADTRWNATHLYLPRGRAFTFSAKGEWKDSRDVCDWRGTEDDEFTAGDVVRSLGGFLGRFEELFRNSEATDFWGTKRVESLPWFTLVGAIANDAGARRAAANDGTPSPHQYERLSDYQSEPLKISKPGYLYCFPNDAWALYGNNRGSVRLTVKCVA